MQIISRGVDPEQQPIQAGCSRCKTVISFLPEEATIRGGEDPRDRAYYEIQCPVCPAKITKAR